MACTCPCDPDCPGICAACANEVARGLVPLGVDYAPEHIMGEMGVNSDEIEANYGLAWDLGVSLPAGHPFAPVVDEFAAA